MHKIKDGFYRQFLITKWVIGLYFRNYPFYSLTYVICRIIAELSPLVNAYILALATDEAIRLLQNDIQVYSIYKILVLTVGSNLLFTLVGIINNYVWRMMSYQDWWKLREILSDKLRRVGIKQLERAELTNKVQRFNESYGSVSDYFQITINSFGVIIAFFGSATIIFKSIPLVAAVYLVTTLIGAMSNQKFIRQLWLVNRDTTEDRRKANASSAMLMDPQSLKELILSGGDKYLSIKVSSFVSSLVSKVHDIRKKWGVFQFFNKIVDSFAFGYGVYILILKVAQKIISVGQLTLEIRSLRIFADNLSQVASNIVDLRETAVKLSDIYDIFTQYPDEEDGQINIDFSNHEISLVDVDFSYPESKTKIFDNLNLSIKKGEKIAIVGENGAGKTTLVKLICRLYKPTSGSMFIDEHNLNDLKSSSWYKNIGILFQDYNAYSNLTLRENIEVDSYDKKVTDKSIIESLKKSDAFNFTSKYRYGLNQILSERFNGGTRPSTGQWQKIAIARVFHRNAPILILDEPTASIDALAEAKIFDNIYKFAKDKTVIIISHRFSTVRNADRIIVLDKGKIVEQGSHQELLDLNGVYAKSFKTQAKGYV